MKNMPIAKENSVVHHTDLKLVSPSSRHSHQLCVLQSSDVMTWSEAKCQTALTSCLEDTAIALKNASLILKVMIEKNYDTSKLPSTWVRAMLRIADGGMLPEVMRDFDGIARLYVSRMPTDVQRKLCDDPTIAVLTEFGEVKNEKIQNLNTNEIRRALDQSGPRSIAQQRQLLTNGDEKEEPKPEPVEPGTFQEAVEFFTESEKRFRHLKEMIPLYAMIDMFKARLKKRVK